MAIQTRYFLFLGLRGIRNRARLICPPTKWIRHRKFTGDPSKLDQPSDRAQLQEADPFPEPLYSGWMLKRGRDLFKRWKRRFFILSHDLVLYWYDDDPTKGQQADQVDAKGALPIPLDA
eukprot:GABV01005597.1.p1 GENE.GABV01005597.1~~GABV01005597.1.p1  ORF type:complete len:119 (-),score=23.78 GABV01005597.1:3-359(-)